MTDASNLPLSLYKANLDLWLRIGELLQENREQWMELLSRELHDSLLETRAEAGQLHAAQDWPAMAMLPGSALWRIAEQQVGDLQALAQTATGNQMTFVNGFQQALSEWQEATASALGGAIDGPALPADLLEGLRDTLGNLSEALLPGLAAVAPSATPAAASAPKRPAAKKAARRTTARTAAKKRPARKTAARKAAAPAKKSPARPVKKAAKKAARKATKKTARRATRKAAR